MLPALSRIIATLCLVALATDVTPTLIVPDFPDLTIKTRVKPIPGPWGERTTWYFKGARLREERQWDPRPNQPPPKLLVNITQCDRKTSYFIDEKELEYEKWSLSEMAAKSRDFLNGEPGDGEVTVSYDSVDTGERRKIGSYEARHLKTTVTFDPSEETGIRPGKIELDGWYIDLPGRDMCEDTAGMPGWQMETDPNHKKPRIIERWRGTRRGFVIEETSKATPGVRSEGRVEFLGIDEEPIDRSLFEVPKDYTQVER